MANVFVPSANDPAVFTTDKFPLLKDGDGNTYRTVVKANVNGSIDVYSKGTGFGGSDELLFQYSGTRNEADFTEGKFKDKPNTAYNSFFISTNSNGEQFVKDVKTKWYSEAPPNAASRISGLQGYRSIAATTPARQTSTGPQSLTIQVQSGAGTTTVTTTSLPQPQPDPEIVARDTQTIAARDAVESAQPINISIPSENVRMDYGPPLFYPQELESNKQDRITFTMKRLTGSTINPNSFESNVKTIDRRNLEEIKGSVTLPIQPSISDNNSVDWSGGTLNAIQAYGAAASMKIIGSDDAVQLGDNVSRIMGVIAREVTTKGLYQDAFKTYFAQEAVGTQNLLSRATGAILNPNLELLFNGPSLRPFAFTFRMSPRDPKEAEQVRKIIRFFKQGMSVKTTPSNVFLQSPNIFAIRYQHWDGEKFSEHPSINRIKRCALISCDVDYTPDGTYMTYNDERKTMTSYQLSLRFSELEPVYEDDYGGASGKTSSTAGRPLANDEIGY